MQTHWQYATNKQLTWQALILQSQPSPSLTLIMQVSKERIGKLEAEKTSLAAEVVDLKTFYMWEMEKLQEVTFSSCSSFVTS